MNAAVVAMAALLVAAPLNADLGGYLERSAEAEFAGEQLVACDTPDGTRSSVFNLAQEDGAVIAWAEGEETPVLGVAPGLTVSITGEAVEATVVEGSPLVDSDLYTVEEGEESSYLGRTAVEVSLLREGAARVQMTVDQETDAVMRTITYTEAGDPYCDRRLLSFGEDTGEVPDLNLDPNAETVTPIGEDPDELEPTIEGFELVDTYALEEGTLSYYSDGFFSAGVAVTERPISFDASDEVVDFESEAGPYRRAFQAGSVTVAWEADVGTVVMIGDLPPDLLESFLEELPPPRRGSIFDRIWSRLFG